MTLRLAIPNKGRLSERSIEILKQAGLEIENGDERRLYANVKRQDLAVMFLRAQDIVKFVHKGAVDVGITGYDLVLESGLDVVVPYRLNFGRCRLSVAVPESMTAKRPEDLPDDLVVATSFPNLTKQYFEKLGKKVEITSIAGAAEIAPILGVADIIVDLVSSGSTLKMNHLRELAVIAESQAVVIANRKAYDGCEQQVQEIISAMLSVTEAENKKYLMADVPKSSLEEVKKAFPGIAGPTIMNIIGRDDVVAVHVVIDKTDAFDAINKLKRMGATGILLTPIDRMVP
ncbi:MAG: ATP phosphoribosyltransferase [Methanomassiliicoccales archaeon]|nr:ATP phosphoribosyltransferase [Methanomassiliicoccales archaeon]MBP7087065.1 ATP phosphoribosyltransferase [Methanomassiliicoccales archaeon]